MFIDVQLKFNFANRSDEFPFYIVISILCSFVVWVFFFCWLFFLIWIVFILRIFVGKKVKAEVLHIILTSAHGL